MNGFNWILVLILIVGIVAFGILIWLVRKEAGYLNGLNGITDNSDDGINVVINNEHED